jgi:hypothetical protein
VAAAAEDSAVERVARITVRLDEFAEADRVVVADVPVVAAERADVPVAGEDGVAAGSPFRGLVENS